MMTLDQRIEAATKVFDLFGMGKAPPGWIAAILRAAVPELFAAPPSLAPMEATEGMVEALGQHEDDLHFIGLPGKSVFQIMRDAYLAETKAT